MSGHGSPRPEDQAEHPNRKVAAEPKPYVHRSWEEYAASDSYRQLGEDMRHDRQMGRDD